jgi:hypothetical protein
VGAAFCVAGREIAELLEPVEASFDDVSAVVFLCIEGRWPPPLLLLAARRAV